MCDSNNRTSLHCAFCCASYHTAWTLYQHSESKVTAAEVKHAFFSMGLHSCGSDLWPAKRGKQTQSSNRKRAGSRCGWEPGGHRPGTNEWYLNCFHRNLSKKYQPKKNSREEEESKWVKNTTVLSFYAKLKKKNAIRRTLELACL